MIGHVGKLGLLLALLTAVPLSACSLPSGQSGVRVTGESAVLLGDWKMYRLLEQKQENAFKLGILNTSSLLPGIRAPEGLYCSQAYAPSLRRAESGGYQGLIVGLMQGTADDLLAVIDKSIERKDYRIDGQDIPLSKTTQWQGKRFELSGVTRKYWNPAFPDNRVNVHIFGGGPYGDWCGVIIESPAKTP
jgi:hypothetical protein